MGFGTLSLRNNTGTYPLTNGTAWGGTVRLMDYTPLYAGDGVETVYEEARVEIIGTSSGQVGQIINGINKMLGMAAKQIDKNFTDIVCLEHTPDGYGTKALVSYNRFSPVHSGKVIHTEDKTLGYPWWNLHKVEAVIGWERENYWQGPGSVTTLQNSNGFGGGGGALELNNSCPKYENPPLSGWKLDNSITVAPTYVDGDLPSPAVITFLNYGTTTGKLYFGCHQWSGSAAAHSQTFIDNYWREGEASSIGGTASSASCSGTAYGVGTAGTAEADMFKWGWGGSGILQRLNGDVYNVMARFSGTAGLANTKFRLKVYTGTVLIWSGPQFRMNTPGEIIQNLGALNMPPSGFYSNSSGTINLAISAQTVTGAATIGLDFIQLFGDQFTQIAGLAPTPVTDQIYYGIVDSLAQVTIRQSAVADYQDLITKGAQVINLDPAYFSHILTLWQSGVGTSAAFDSTMRVTIYQNARWRTL